MADSQQGTQSGMKKSFDSKKGYIALMATLIISFVLLSVSIITNFGSFQSLSGALNRELKEISLNLAESCLDQAIVISIQRPNWQPPEGGKRLYIEEYSCLILETEREDSLITIETEGQAGRAFTILRAVFDEENLKIISLEEI